MTIDPTIQSKGYTVLSLFDGMSCGQIALKKLGIKVFKYFASEIKPHAINVFKPWKLFTYPAKYQGYQWMK